MKLSIATEYDIDNLCKLCVETFYKKWLSTNTEKDLQTYMNQYFSKENIRYEINNKNITFLLVQTENDFIGYCKLNRNNKEGSLENLLPIEIQRMYVKEEFIRKGVGKILMNKAIELATKEKFEVIWLGVWEYNLLAINFYKSFGFEFYGSHEFVLGEDITTDLLMKKVL